MARNTVEIGGQAWFRLMGRVGSGTVVNMRWISNDTSHDGKMLVYDVQEAGGTVQHVPYYMIYGHEPRLADGLWA